MDPRHLLATVAPVAADTKCSVCGAQATGLREDRALDFDGMFGPDTLTQASHSEIRPSVGHPSDDPLLGIHHDGTVNRENRGIGDRD